VTHDELLALLKGYAESAGLRMDRNAWLTLSDVVELHRPAGRYCFSCIGENAKGVLYPCPTIEVIEKELT
jgi:hypothetical protein